MAVDSLVELELGGLVVVGRVLAGVGQFPSG
jgi:hypothetical protein